MEANEQESNIWNCQLLGDEKVAEIKPSSIFLVGESKVGKSTLFNYMMRFQLKAIVDEETLEEMFECTQNVNGAVVKAGYKSVTLVPNIYPRIYLGEQEHQISMQDMAGYGDTGRDYVGVFGVSYMLKVALSHARRARFILVIEENKIMTGQIQDCVKPFYNFVDMLRVEYLAEAPQVGKKLASSLSLVVTKSTRSIQLYLRKLELIMKFLQNEEKNNKNKMTLLLVESICASSRVQIFEKANAEAILPRCQILENLLKCNWQEFDFTQDSKPENLIRLPFKRDYGLLAESEKAKYNAKVNDKIKGMKEGLAIISQLILKAKNSWLQEGKIDYQAEFNLLRDLIAKHNHYGHLPRINKHLKMPLEIKEGEENIVNKIMLMEHLLAIIEKLHLLNELMAKQGEKETQLLELQKPILEFFVMIKRAFCQSKTEETEFAILSFILWRGLYEASVILHIDGQRGSEVFFAFQEEIQKMSMNTIQSLKAEYLIKAPITEQSIGKLAEHIMDSRIHLISDSNLLEAVYRRQISIQIFMADSQAAKGERKEAINTYIKAMDAILRLRSTQEAKPEKDAKVQKFVEFRMIDILQKIGLCLQEIGCYADALRFFEKCGSIHLKAKCFEHIISTEKDPMSKAQQMGEYAKFCKDYGRQSKAIEIYQEMLDTFIYLPRDRKDIMKKLENCLGPFIVRTDYLENLQEMQQEENFFQFDENHFDDFKKRVESGEALDVPQIQEEAYDYETLLIESLE